MRRKIIITNCYVIYKGREKEGVGKELEIEKGNGRERRGKGEEREGEGESK